MCTATLAEAIRRSSNGASPSNIPLLWMASYAKAGGLQFKPGSFSHAQLALDATAAIHQSRTGAYCIFPPSVRNITAESCLASSVKARCDDSKSELRSGKPTLRRWAAWHYLRPGRCGQYRDLEASVAAVLRRGYPPRTPLFANFFHFLGLRDQAANYSFHLSYSQECWNQSPASASAGSSGKILDALRLVRPLGLLPGYWFKVIVLGGIFWLEFLGEIGLVSRFGNQALCG